MQSEFWAITVHYTVEVHVGLMPARDEVRTARYVVKAEGECTHAHFAGEKILAQWRADDAPLSILSKDVEPKVTVVPYRLGDRLR